MGMLRTTLSAAALAAALAGCGSQAVEPAPSPSPITSRTPSPTATTVAPPTMPEAAKAHTAEGAKAFVVYYMDLITYAENSLDTRPIEHASLQTCSGCYGGIKAIRLIAKQEGTITGGRVTASAIRAGAIDSRGVVTLGFRLTSAKEQVAIPGKPTAIHASGIHKMLITLVAADEGWKVSEYGARP
jgi:hypothetical protein